MTHPRNGAAKRKGAAQRKARVRRDQRLERAGPLTGPERRKIHAKLRMFANGDLQVNTVRAEYACGLAMSKKARLAHLEPLLTADAVPSKEKAPRPKGRKAEKEAQQRRLPSEVLANVFIRTVRPDVAKIVGEVGRKRDVIAATIRLSDLPGIAKREDVMQIDLGESLADPQPTVSPGPAKPPRAVRRISFEAKKHQGGKGVLIGIVDVQGFDFSHPDFLDAQGRTRFKRIWDQGGSNRERPKGLGQAAFGAEIRGEHMEAALRAARTRGVPAWELEPQSEMVPGSHGTHVASIAAGNLGVCPGAMLAGVLVSMPAKDIDGRRSFYDSTRVAHAVDYLFALADELDIRAKAVVINVSLGTNGHAHDSSSAVSRWIDAELTVPGRAVCVAAGNAGQEVSEFDGDLGWVMGRIHTSGRVPARGLTTDIEWVVVGNGTVDLSENELELWYGAQDRFRVWIRPPGSASFLGPIDPREYIQNQQRPDGSFLSVYNELYHPANGANRISIFLSPNLRRSQLTGVSAGTWVVRLEGLEIKDGSYHGWIERDDPRPRGRVGEKEHWNFPSFFSPRSNVDNSSVSTLACGQRILSVANLDGANLRISKSSSQGPTRDGRNKPDVAAPGTDVVAARGFASPEDPWVAMSGTSMAAPYVTGVAGLMLAVEPGLTAAQIEGIVHRSATPLPGASYAWSNAAGFGVIEPEGCLREALAANKPQEVTR